MTDTELLIRYLRAEDGQDKNNMLYWLQKKLLEGGKDDKGTV